MLFALIEHSFDTSKVVAIKNLGEKNLAASLLVTLCYGLPLPVQ